MPTKRIFSLPIEIIIDKKQKKKFVFIETNNSVLNYEIAEYFAQQVSKDFIVVITSTRFTVKK